MHIDLWNMLVRKEKASLGGLAGMYILIRS